MYQVLPECLIYTVCYSGRCGLAVLPTQLFLPHVEFTSNGCVCEVWLQLFNRKPSTAGISTRENHSLSPGHQRNSPRILHAGVVILIPESKKKIFREGDQEKG